MNRRAVVRSTERLWKTLITRREYSMATRGIRLCVWRLFSIDSGYAELCDRRFGWRRSLCERYLVWLSDRPLRRSRDFFGRGTPARGTLVAIGGDHAPRHLFHRLGC